MWSTSPQEAWTQNNRQKPLFRSFVGLSDPPLWFNPSNLVLRAETWLRCPNCRPYFETFEGIRVARIDSQCCQLPTDDLLFFLRTNSGTLQELHITMPQQDAYRRRCSRAKYEDLNRLWIPNTPLSSITGNQGKKARDALTELRTLVLEVIQWMGILLNFRLERLTDIRIQLPPVIIPDSDVDQETLSSLLASVTRFFSGLQSLRQYRLEFESSHYIGQQVAFACLRWIGVSGSPKHLEKLELVGGHIQPLLVALYSHFVDIIQSVGGVLDLVRLHDLDETRSFPPPSNTFSYVSRFLDMVQFLSRIPEELDVPITPYPGGATGTEKEFRLFLDKKITAVTSKIKSRSFRNDPTYSPQDIVRLMARERTKHRTRKAVKDIRIRTSRLKTLTLGGIVCPSSELTDLFLILGRNVQLEVDCFDGHLIDPLCSPCLALVAQHVRHLRLTVSPEIPLSNSDSRKCFEVLRSSWNDDSDDTQHVSAVQQSLSDLPPLEFSALRSLTLTKLHPKYVDVLVSAFSRWDIHTDKHHITKESERSAASGEERKPTVAWKLPEVPANLQTDTLEGIALSVIFAEAAIKGHDSIQEPELLLELKKLIRCLHPSQLAVCPIPGPMLLSRFQSIARCSQITLRPVTTTRFGSRWSQLRTTVESQQSSRDERRITKVTLYSPSDLQWVTRCFLETDSLRQRVLRPSFVNIKATVGSLVAVAFAWDNYPLAHQLGLWHCDRLIQTAFHHITLCDLVHMYEASLQGLQAEYSLPIDIHFARVERLAEFFLLIRHCFASALSRRHCEMYTVTIDFQLRMFDKPLPLNLCPLASEPRLLEEAASIAKSPTLASAASDACKDEPEDQHVLLEVQKFKEQREKAATEVFMSALMAMGVQHKTSLSNSQVSNYEVDDLSIIGEAEPTSKCDEAMEGLSLQSEIAKVQQSSLLQKAVLSQDTNGRASLAQPPSTVADTNQNESQRACANAARVLLTSETLLAEEFGTGTGNQSLEIFASKPSLLHGSSVATHITELQQLRDVLRKPMSHVTETTIFNQSKPLLPSEDTVAVLRYTRDSSTKAQAELRKLQKDILSEELDPPPPLLLDMTGAYHDESVISPPYPDGGKIIVRITKTGQPLVNTHLESARRAMRLATKLRAWAAAAGKKSSSIQ